MMGPLCPARDVGHVQGLAGHAKYLGRLEESMVWCFAQPAVPGGRIICRASGLTL